MFYSKSWFDENAELWIAENVNRGGYKESYILREFHYMFTGTDVTQDNINEMQKYMEKYYPRLNWRTTVELHMMEKMEWEKCEFGVVGGDGDNVIMRIMIKIKDMIVNEISIEKD